MESLYALGQKHGTDKTTLSKTHGISYLHIYEKLFRQFDRNEQLSILEIGVRDGASINMLLEYFPNATVTGIDICDCQFNVYDESRYDFYQGAQSDYAVLAKAAANQGPFDIIIDDGSHLIKDFTDTFYHLIQCLKRPGLYIIEDLQNNYYEQNCTRSTRPNDDGRAFDIFHGRLAKLIHMSRVYDYKQMDPKIFSLHTYPGFLVIAREKFDSDYNPVK